MVNYLNVSAEKDRKEAKENAQKKEKAPPSIEHLQQGFKRNEQRLMELAAEEKARREAGGSGPKELALRLGDRMPRKKSPQTQPERKMRPTPAADEISGPDARFRAELQKQPIEYLKRFCGEIGVAAHGNKEALVERLAAHAREHHARRQQQQTQQQPPPPQQPQDSRPPTGASSSSRARRLPFLSGRG